MAGGSFDRCFCEFCDLAISFVLSTFGCTEKNFARQIHFLTIQSSKNTSAPDAVRGNQAVSLGAPDLMDRGGLFHVYLESNEFNYGGCL